MTKFTVIGSKGFIGSNLISYFKNKNFQYQNFDDLNNIPHDKNLGHVIFSIGLTSDFRERPFDTVNSHVCELIKILKNVQFDSFLYLSSTRVYQNSKSTEEKNDLIVNSNNKNDIYNISKILGESVCLNSRNKNVKIIRLSNVVGNNFTSDDFLPSLIKNAVNEKKITLNSSMDSEKDYVLIDDVVEIIPKIVTKGTQTIYNVASGKNIKTKEIISKLIKITGCTVEENDTTLIKFPKISIDSLISEFQFSPTNLVDRLEYLVTQYENYRNK
ncbi:MAG: SDR family oxidoreductase [Nitrosarchaeum sp.]|nr:SDR family oxidoreductase [Nitrosarchaeum sp.]